MPSRDLRIWVRLEDWRADVPALVKAVADEHHPLVAHQPGDPTQRTPLRLARRVTVHDAWHAHKSLRQCRYHVRQALGLSQLEPNNIPATAIKGQYPRSPDALFRVRVGACICVPRALLQREKPSGLAPAGAWSLIRLSPMAPRRSTQPYCSSATVPLRRVVLRVRADCFAARPRLAGSFLFRLLNKAL